MGPNCVSERDRIIREIASRVLGIETLETRNRNGLDFHDVAVWSIREALETAFAAGLAAGKKKASGCLRCQRP